MSISPLDTKPYAPPDESYLPFQLGSIQEMFLRSHILLADEMGLGKTIQVIGYINIAHPSNVLVVCPNNLRLNWLSELHKWLDPGLCPPDGAGFDSTREENVSVRNAEGCYDIEMCTSSLYIPSNFVLASYEGLVKWSSMLALTQWDLCVLDEIHYIKNRSTQRAHAAFTLQEHSVKRIGLTGTPICNYPDDLFGIIHWLDSEQWPSAAKFKSRYQPYSNKHGYHMSELQDFLRNGTTRKVIRKVPKRSVKITKTLETAAFTCNECQLNVGYEASASTHVQETGHSVHVLETKQRFIVPAEEVFIDEVNTERACGLMIRRLKKEVLPELPRKRRQVIELPAEGLLLDLVNKEKELFQREYDAWREMSILLESLSENDTEETFEKSIENLKFTHKYMFTEMAIIRHALARAKVPYIIDHLENVLENKDKVILGVHHVDVGQSFFEHFKNKAVFIHGDCSLEERSEQVNIFWNDSSCELFIGTLRCAGLGLNLQCASHIVLAESDWGPGVMTQFEDRAHRIGQDESLLIQYIVAQDSMDSKMAKLRINKQKSIVKALDR